jgi:hypothetical protein
VFNGGKERCVAGGVFIVDEDDAKQRDAGGWGVALLGRGGSAREVRDGGRSICRADKI